MEIIIYILCGMLSLWYAYQTGRVYGYDEGYADGERRGYLIGNANRIPTNERL